MTRELRLAAREACVASAELRRRSVGVMAESGMLLAHLEAQQVAARRIADLERRVVNLQAAMHSRAVIEQAKGVIISETGVNENRAFELLVAQSQYENVKLRDVARLLVDSKIRTSDPRSNPTPPR
jgi:hypothetical protein